MRKQAEEAGTPFLFSFCIKKAPCETKMSSFTQAELNIKRIYIFLKIWKLTILSCKSSIVWTLWSSSQTVFTDTRTCFIGKCFLTCGPSSQLSGTRLFQSPRSCVWMEYRPQGISSRIHHSKVIQLNSSGNTFSKLDFLLLETQKIKLSTHKSPVSVKN